MEAVLTCTLERCLPETSPFKETWLLAGISRAGSVPQQGMTRYIAFVIIPYFGRELHWLEASRRWSIPRSVLSHPPLDITTSRILQFVSNTLWDRGLIHSAHLLLRPFCSGACSLLIVVYGA